MKAPQLRSTSLLAAIPFALFTVLAPGTLISCAQINGVIQPLGLGVSAKQTLEADVTELQSMRAEMESSWAGIQGRVTTVEQDVAQFGPGDQLQGSNVDLAALSEDILMSSEVQVSEAGATRVETVDVEAAYRDTDAATRAEIAQVQTEGKRIMSELKQGIPLSMGELSVDASKTVAKAVTIQVKAENMKSVAENNPLMSDADMATMRANTALIESEVNKLNILAERIAMESQGVSGRMSDALTTFQSVVTAFK